MTDKIKFDKNGQWTLDKGEKPKFTVVSGEKKVTSKTPGEKPNLGDLMSQQTPQHIQEYVAHARAAGAGEPSGFKTKQNNLHANFDSDAIHYDHTGNNHQYVSQHSLTNELGSPVAFAEYNHNPNNGTFELSQMWDHANEKTLPEDHPNYNAYKNALDSHVKQHNDEGNWSWHGQQSEILDNKTSVVRRNALFPHPKQQQYYKPIGYKTKIGRKLGVVEPSNE